MLSLGQRLQKARKMKGMTQQEVADKFGISHGTLSGYERNYRDPDTEVLNRLADLYNVSVDWLVGRTNDSKQVLSQDARLLIDSLEMSDEEIIKTFNLTVDGISLTPEQIKSFIGYVRIERMKNMQGPN